MVPGHHTSGIVETDVDPLRGDGMIKPVPHVVFTCGAVPATDREVVGPDDEILVYYGAADTSICVARGTLRDLVPTIDDLDPARGRAK